MVTFRNTTRKIRVEEIKKAFELCLSLFSMTFGFGSKKYVFEQNQIQTATQYIGERQDCMQELNKQREEARQYISGIVRAILWFSNTFQNTSFDLTADICIDFDDSYIEDKNTRMESMRTDAQYLFGYSGIYHPVYRGTAECQAGKEHLEVMKAGAGG